MKVTLQTYGGLGAAMAGKSQTVNAGQLSQSAADELTRLVEAAKRSSTAQPDTPGSARDEMSYDVTIEEAGKSTVLSQSDTNKSPAFSALVRWITKEARKP